MPLQLKGLWLIFLYPCFSLVDEVTRPDLEGKIQHCPAFRYAPLGTMNIATIEMNCYAANVDQPRLPFLAGTWGTVRAV